MHGTPGTACPQIQQNLASACEMVRIFFTDLLHANLTCMLPNAISWAYRTQWTGSISSSTFQTAAGKTAHLFAHSNLVPRADGKVSAVLLLHGDHAHPFSMLHLGDIAEAKGRAVFSVSLPYDDLDPKSHRSLLQKSIRKIEKMIIAKGGTLSDLVLAGHSRGALEAANEAYVARNPKIGSVVAIAGRFQVIEPSQMPCRESLKPSVNAVWERVHDTSQKLDVPFNQIAAMRDWCIDPEASIVRWDHNYRIVDAGHLGVIYHPDTLNQFREWVAVPANA